MRDGRGKLLVAKHYTPNASWGAMYRVRWLPPVLAYSVVTRKLAYLLKLRYDSIAKIDQHLAKQPVRGRKLLHRHFLGGARLLPVCFSALRNDAVALRAARL